MIDLRRRAAGPEQMDATDLDPAVYAVVLNDLAKVNGTTLAYRPTLAFLDRATRGKPFRLLDVGFGQGDMLRSIRRWAVDRRIDARLVGIDLNPRSEDVARAASVAGEDIEFRTGDAAELAGEGFDLIVSSLVAHHMDDAELVAFLRFMETSAKRGWFINDLRRSRLAWEGYPWLARMMGWHRIVREDGQLSIARSFRPQDWRRLLTEAGIEGARIVSRFPFRLCVERLR